MRLIRFPLLVLPLLVSLFPVQANAVKAQQAIVASAEPASGSVVCPPGVYAAPPDDCLPLGPSEYLNQLAQTGITLPIPPIPDYPYSYDLNNLPYVYFKVTDQGAPVFGSMGDAAANANPINYLNPGELYVSYIDREETDGGVVYQLRSGVWIRGDGGRLSVPVFQGQLFSSTPRNTFGWVLGTIPVYSAPGFSSPQTGRSYYRYNMVQIFATAQADSVTWDMIGPDQWLEGRHVGSVTPRSSPPDGVPADRWIEVNLQEQTLAVYENERLVFATLVSSGVTPFWTRPGVFQIQTKKPTETMTKAYAPGDPDFYYIEDVPWTMYFDESRALHGAYWHNGFGYPRSHGCVNLSVGDSHWLFDWANVGDYVYVFDPSGQTPTDPSLYGSGAP
jgi:hypothetical protein